MTLKQLEAFYWAAVCASFGVAADRIHISVSSLSKRLSELEESLGQALFDRSGHRATLTDAGARLLPLASSLLKQADHLRQEVGAAAGLRGPCRIGVGELTALTWLPQLVSALTSSYPDLELSVQVDIGDALTEKLLSGELDVALIAGISNRSQLLCTPIARAEFRWCARPQVAGGLGVMSATALNSYPLVTLPLGSGVTHILDEWFREACASPGRRLFCNHWGAVVGLLVHTNSIGVLPEAWAGALEARSQLTVLRSEIRLQSLEYALYTRRDDLRPLVNALQKAVSATADFTVTSSVF
jgi:DNA-binding transcriptional LysR family regulator